MTKILFFSILFYHITFYSHSQINPDYAKLAKTCELWGLIKFFHPDQPGQNFDSAFAAQVPKMLDAQTEDEWRHAITDWLTVLNDLSTKVVSNSNSQQSTDILRSEFLSDSILYVKISGSSIYDDDKGGAFIEATIGQIEKSKGIIFDLRQENEIPRQYEGYLDLFFDYYGLSKALATEVVPQYRTIYYSGFAPEKGMSSGNYTINDILTKASVSGNFESLGQKAVWIVNGHSELPVVSLSQQAAGVGYILNETEELNPLIPLTKTFDISDELKIKFRTTEVVLPNGHFPRAEVYTPSDNPVKMAETLIGNEKPFKEETKPGSTKSTSQSDTDIYPIDKYPTIGYRILAAAKMFNIIEMFFPYHEYMDRNWRDVLKESLPEFIEVQNEVEYGLAVAKMHTNINDSHGYISGNKGLDQLSGEAPSPMVVDWIEDRIVVTACRKDSVCNLNGISIGDIVTKINGTPVDELMEKYEVYYPHSNKATIKQTAARYCIRGPENQEGIFTIEDKDGESKDIKLKWTDSYNKNFSRSYKLDTIQLINENIGYADLTRMERDQTDEMFETLKNTKVIIFDMRGYPNGTAWTIAPRLSEKQNVPLARFRKNEILAPMIPFDDKLFQKSYTEFVQTVASTDKWKYEGRTIMLIDQDAISQSEHTGLFFESVNNTLFIGSQTAGANGDVTNFEIPGGINLSFSGQGVWHADGRQLQRVGLVPHVQAKPTVNGIRSNRDEVLDKALEWIDKNIE